MKKFTNWHEIKEWFEERGYHLTAKRMQLNNDCWMSSGEFGRSQVAICDAMRFCDTEEEREEVGRQIEESMMDDDLLACVGVTTKGDTVCLER